jgi:hypothetical protein
MRLTVTPGTSSTREVQSGRLAFDVRVGAQNDLGDALALHAGEQLAREAARDRPLQVVDRTTEHVIRPRNWGALDRNPSQAPRPRTTR